MKGLMPIQKGDKIQFLCDYYAYDGTFISAYELGDPITAGTNWDIGYATIGDAAWSMCYRLTDVYSAQYWTPAITR